MMKEAFQQVLGAGLDNYHKPKYWDICGVKVQFKPVPNGVPAGEWKNTLEEWLPKYESAGWLEGLHKIKISEKAAHRLHSEAVGRYNHDGTVYLNNRMDLYDGVYRTLVHDGSREAVMTHEVIHHAHLTLNGFEGSRKASNKQRMLKEDVSYYAGSNVGEAVAEIGTGIVHGQNFPSWVHEYYEEKDGPQEVYDIGETLR